MPKVVRSAFINCPFDAQYRDCFEAVVFTCMACGVAPRTALAGGGAKAMRYSGLIGLIADAEIGIHDLSRTESDHEGRPRFNMPFELGLFLGAKEFGGPKHRRKLTLVLVRQKYALGPYLSDLAGLDPVAHGDDPVVVIKHVRDALNGLFAGEVGRAKRAKNVPGPQKIIAAFVRFKADLPKIAAAKDFDASAFNVLDSHNDFCVAVDEFLAIVGLGNRRAYPA